MGDPRHDKPTKKEMEVDPFKRGLNLKQQNWEVCFPKKSWNDEIFLLANHHSLVTPEGGNSSKFQENANEEITTRKRIDGSPNGTCVTVSNNEHALSRPQIA